AGQLPDQVTIDRAKKQLFSSCLGSCAVDILQYPLEFGAREIWIEQKPGLFIYFRFETFGFERITPRRRASVLPDNGIIDRLARIAIPDQRGLPLIGDADGRNILRRQP